MSKSLAAILGGAAGAMTLAVLVLVLLWFCILKNRRNASRTSESNSSDPSHQAGQNIEFAMREHVSYLSDSHEARCFILEELRVATKNFSNSHLIGRGMFGEVYKGLLPDMIVAIKKRWASPNRQLIEEVRYLSSIRHRNLVSLLGYCQENDLQMLVYEYIPNRNVSAHLYGSSQNSGRKLEFKQRLSIAYGAAKGLAHLHSLNPPFVHMDFKTANVLVDENFAPKIADVGLRSLLDKIDGGVPSARSMEDDFFLDPEVKESGIFSDKSDVYSFGVFLLELISGQEAIQFQFLESGSIYQWGQNDYQDSSDISTLVDPRMSTSSFTAEGMRDFIRLAVWCLNPSSGRRPPTSFVATEIERIHEKEMNMTTIMGEGTPVVTLGSQLFTSSSSA